MNLTPRQAAAWLEFFGFFDGIEQSRNLMITAIGAQGDKDAIEQAARELCK